MKLYSVNLIIDVTDPVEAVKSARNYLVDECNYSEEEALDAVPDGEVETALCLLFDPGENPAGVAIVDSSAEEILK